MKREILRPRSNIASVRPTPGIEPGSHSLQRDGVTNYATAPSQTEKGEEGPKMSRLSAHG
eukprot:CAMPEP_0113685286 /NCGR_PEP_ID=MMETSP0038_2-20120614/14570_1 /TAXON_ID=2898 /ORGANISM="Cryptomonas paramecium" /LENGTH=59 /DNA_ID=CAMNT_0000605321 /DNA_START=58 /DNA_END=234 /DNA_ORIENTATION=+ /assembly_acc=CAM_ASM_000170